MSIDQLVDLVTEKRLYMRRSNKFSDRLEGRLPIYSEQAWFNIFIKNKWTKEDREKNVFEMGS
ncbi:MAG: hypothetical protein R3A13_06960 [Bdellovibrionota bacterium]